MAILPDDTSVTFPVIILVQKETKSLSHRRKKQEDGITVQAGIIQTGIIQKQFQSGEGPVIDF